MIRHLDWTPVLRSLFYYLNRAGFKFDYIEEVKKENSLHPRMSLFDAIQYLSDNLEGTVVLDYTLPASTTVRSARIYLKLYTVPEDITADWLACSSTIQKALEDAIDKFMTRWKGISCPVIETSIWELP